MYLARAQVAAYSDAAEESWWERTAAEFVVASVCILMMEDSQAVLRDRQVRRCARFMSSPQRPTSNWICWMNTPGGAHYEVTPLSRANSHICPLHILHKLHIQKCLDFSLTSDPSDCNGPKTPNTSCHLPFVICHFLFVQLFWNLLYTY